MASKCPISILKIKYSNTHATSSVSALCVRIHIVHIRKISPNYSVVYNGEFAVGYSNWINFGWSQAWESVSVAQLMQSGHSGSDRNLAEVKLAYDVDFEASTPTFSSFRSTLLQFAVLIQKWHLGSDPKKHKKWCSHCYLEYNHILSSRCFVLSRYWRFERN